MTTAAGAIECAGMPWRWSADPVVIGLLACVTGLYIAGSARQRLERRPPKSAALRAMSFGFGVLVLVMTLLSPLDDWGDELFAAHMAQHLMLMMVAPPLLVMGRPFIVAMWALPVTGRRRVASWWLRSHRFRAAIEMLLAPLTAWLLASAALWFWHLPKPYGLAFQIPAIHAAEHLSFFLTSILFWRVVIDGPQAGRLSIGAAMILVVTFAMENAMLAALLIFAPKILYAVHASTPAWSELTPLEDQQLAGVLMWAVTGTVDLVVLCLLFVDLLDRGRRRTGES